MKQVYAIISVALVLLFSSPLCNARLSGRVLSSSCEDDSMQCPDGSFVGRDATNNCEFEACPQFQCCDWEREPGKYANNECDSGSHVCCRNGEWGCALPGLERSFLCGGVPSIGPFPEACPCCEPELMPVCQVGEPQCCGESGRWACPINNEGNEYNCGDDVLPMLDGPLCIIKARNLVEVRVAPGYEGGTSMPSASPNDEETPPRPQVLQAAEAPPEIQMAVEAPKDTLRAQAVPVPSQTPPSMPTKSLKAEPAELLGPPIRACKGPEILCWDGSTVKPDPENDCQTPPCPSPEPCCDPRQETECEEGYIFCCDDGSWICANDEGLYRCGDEILEKPPNGKICEKPVTETKCCDPTVPSTIRCGYGGPFCCEDGSWACKSKDDTYLCGGSELKEPPDGDVCDPAPVVPGCPEIMQMCPDGTVIQPDPDNNCQLPKCPERCMSDTRTCADGTVLKRDPDNECIMPPCPDDIKICPQDDSLMTCPDGSEVYRDPANDCEFFPCPEFSCCDPNREYGSISNPAMCFEGHVCCPDGTWTCGNGDGSFSCGGEVRAGPFPEACPCCDTLEKPDCEKAGCCEDGTWSCPTEDGKYNCGDELSNSPRGIVCATAAIECPELKCWDGTIVQGDPENDCRMRQCPPGPKDKCCDSMIQMDCKGEGPYCCDGGMWTCESDDGTFICGDTELTEPPDGDECDYIEPLGCPEDLKLCPDGTQLQRDPLNDCEFPQCPDETKCCDPTMPTTMKCAFGIPYCCEDGTWTCASEKNTFTCGELELKEPPDGDVCEIPVKPTVGSAGEVKDKCCDPNLEPGQYGNPFCFEGHQCCPDGEWSCSIGDAKTFPCGGILITEGFGEKCPCCEPEMEPKCLIGTAGCCEGGNWTCPSNGIYLCGGDETEEPAGTICEEAGVVLPQGCTKEAFICPDGSSVGRDPNNNCEFRPCPVIKTTDTSPTDPADEIEKTREEKKAEKEAELLKRQEEREEAKRQKEEERKKRQEEAARQKAEREAAREKKDADRLKRQEEKAARQKEREKERAERQEAAERKRADAKAARDAERAKRQEEKEARQQENANKRGGRENESKHERKPREED